MKACEVWRGPSGVAQLMLHLSTCSSVLRGPPPWQQSQQLMVDVTPTLASHFLTLHARISPIDKVFLLCSLICPNVPSNLGVHLAPA